MALLLLALIAPLAGAAPNQRIATGRENLDALEDALLAESVYGDLQGAARTYEQLVRTLSVEDPSRAEALFALGRVRAELDEPHAAREALLEGIRTGSCLDPCQELLGRIELEADSITTLPVRWTFDDSDHGFFHPWQFDDKGTIRLERTTAADAQSNTALVWHTIIDIRKGDQLIVGFRRPTPEPRTLAFSARSRVSDAWLHVVILDDFGRTYALPTGAFWVPVERTVRIEVDLNEVHPVDPVHPLLDPGRINRVQIRDVSAVEGAPPGPNTLYLDDFTVD